MDLLDRFRRRIHGRRHSAPTVRWQDQLAPVESRRLFQKPPRQTREMLETTPKPVNMYSNTSMDHGYESGTSPNSRRNSTTRRFTMLSRFPKNGATDVARKISCQVESSSQGDFDEYDLRPIVMNKRRMSVPEGLTKNHIKDYMIVRPMKNQLSTFEIICSFDRTDEPHKVHLQAKYCDDAQPSNNSVMVFVPEMTVKNVVSVLGVHGHNAALVRKIDCSGQIFTFTTTDCLTAVYMLHTENRKNIASMTLEQFLNETGAKTAVSADSFTNLWDAARLMIVNNVRSLCVFDQLTPVPGNILFFLNFKAIVEEAIVNVADHTFRHTTKLVHATVKDAGVGTYTDFVTVAETATCANVLELIINKKLSSIPVINEVKQLLGVITKRDVLNKIVALNDYEKLMKVDVKELISEQQKLYHGCAEMTVADVAKMLVRTKAKSLYLTGVNDVLTGVVSYGDIVRYIVNLSPQGSPKVSTSSSSADSTE